MIYKFIIKIILRLHTFLYQMIGLFSIKAEGGIHPKHRLMNYHKFFLDNIEPGNKVLDVGCGKGELTFDLAKKAEMVIGVDLNKKSIEFAKKRFSASNVKYLIGDVTKDLPGKEFNVIILSNVLEHIEDRPEFLNQIKRLAPKILIRVPMIDRHWVVLYKKELGLEWMSDRGHFIEYTFKSFKNELEKAGLKIQDYSIQFGEIWAVVINNI